MAANLSRKQLRTLEELIDFGEEHGYMPSLRELASRMDLAYATVRQHLDVLEKKGWVQADGRAHGLRVLRRPGTRERPPEPAATARGVAIVPLVGVVAAGSPIESCDDLYDTVEIPADMLRPAAYALRVKGDSMIEEGILDGDLVVVAPQPDPPDGSLVVALVEGRGATLKRLYRERSRVRLQPANSALEPIYDVSPRSQGVVVGLVRNYARHRPI